MIGWMGPRELLRARAHEFDPVVEGARHGLAREQSLAIWDRICAEAGDGASRLDSASVQQRFHQLVAQVTADVGPDVGRFTRVGIELDRATRVASRTLATRIPGRETRVTVESRRWDRAAGDLSGPPDVSPHPGAMFAGRLGAPVAAAVMRSAERTEIDPAAAELLARARRGGAPLDAALRSRLEATLGAQLDGVRVYTGADADAAARALGARAFAIGEDVVFRDGAYDAHGRDGQQLIAHEVAHTVQARRAAHADPPAGVSEPGDPSEREADAFAEAFVRGPDGAGDATPAGGATRRETATGEPAAAGAGARGAIYRQVAPPAGSTGDPAQLREALRAAKLELDDQDVARLSHLYPDGIVLAEQPLQLLAILPDAYFGRWVLAFEARPPRQLQPGVATYLLPVGHGRAIVLSSQGGPSVMLDAGSLTARPAVAQGLSELLQTGLAAPPQRILVSSTDADHTNQITRVLGVAGMQGAQIEVARQIISSAIGRARWERLGLTRVADQVVEINVAGGDVHQQRRVFGNMVITELRLESAHTAAADATTASGYRSQANAVSPVTVMQDMVTGETQVFYADATPHAISGIIDSIGEDAYRALLGGGGRNLRQAEVPHHGGTVGAADASGFIRNLRIQFEASNGALGLHTQTGQGFSSGEFAVVHVLDQVGVDVTRITEPGAGPGTNVTRLQGGTSAQLSLNQGQLQQVIQAAQRVATGLVPGQRRLHELRELQDQLSTVRDGVTGLAEQTQSVNQLAQELQTQREALEQRLDAFWTELLTAASGPQGMRAGIDVSRVQAEGQAAQGLVDQNPIEPLRESVEAHRGMLSLTEALLINGSGMLEALQANDVRRVEILKAEQEVLFHRAATVIGAREVMEHVRTAWSESWASPRTFRKLAARIGEVAAEREIEARVTVAAGRRIEAQVRTQQIADGTLPGGAVNPAPLRTRIGAGVLAALEVLSLAIEVVGEVRQANEAATAAAAAQVQRGRNMVQWWVDRGVRPQLALLDDSDHPIALSQDQIWQALFGTPPPGVPQNARAVVTQVTVEDRRRAVAILTVSCTTINDWYLLVDDDARAREVHGWRPFIKQGVHWWTLEFDVAANEYEVSFDQGVHDALERLHTRLVANQEADLEILNAGAPVKTVRNTAFLSIGEKRVVWVWASPNLLCSVDFGSTRPRFVRTTDPVISERPDGKVVVRAADAATYLQLRRALWITDQQYINANGSGYYFEPNEEGKALADPDTLEPAPAAALP